jgi:2-dehydropantoate 2-reductase
MRIAVVGAGGVGGFFGGKLASAGHDVTFVARGRHLEAILANGLVVESTTGNFTVAPARAVERLADVGPVDIAMLCVKLWDVEPTAPALAPLLSGGGVVVPFQNGVDSPATLQRVLGEDKVLGGVAYIAATIRQPGVIAHTGTMARLTVGAFDPRLASQAAAFAAACAAAGVACENAVDIRQALWKKYVFLAAMSGVTSLARQPVGVVRADADLRAAFAAAMQEAVAVAKAHAVDLGDDFVARQLTFIDTLPAEMRSSMQNDLAAGNRLEAPWLAGGVARMARAVGVPAPVNATIFAALKPYVDGTVRTGVPR